jgi:hypothetical protein
MGPLDLTKECNLGLAAGQATSESRDISVS